MIGPSDSGGSGIHPPTTPGADPPRRDQRSRREPIRLGSAVDWTFTRMYCYVVFGWYQPSIFVCGVVSLYSQENSSFCRNM